MWTQVKQNHVAFNSHLLFNYLIINYVYNGLNKLAYLFPTLDVQSRTPHPSVTWNITQHEKIKTQSIHLTDWLSANQHISPYQNPTNNSWVARDSRWDRERLSDVEPCTTPHGKNSKSMYIPLYSIIPTKLKYRNLRDVTFWRPSSCILLLINLDNTWNILWNTTWILSNHQPNFVHSY